MLLTRVTAQSIPANTSHGLVGDGSSHGCMVVPWLERFRLYMFRAALKVS